MSNTDARPTQVLPYTSNLDKERRGPAAAAAEGLRHMEEQAAWDEDPDAALAAQTKADDEDRRGVVSFDGSPPRGSIGALRVSARALVAEQRSHLRFGDGKVVEGPLSAAGVAIEDDLQCIDAADNRLSLKLDEASRRESFIPLYRSDLVPEVREAAAAVAEAARADRLERSFQVRGMPVVLASDERPLRDRGTLETLTDSMREALELEFGVAVRWVESASRDTAESARLSAPLLAAAQWKFAPKSCTVVARAARLQAAGDPTRIEGPLTGERSPRPLDPRAPGPRSCRCGRPAR